MSLIHFYRRNALSEGKRRELLSIIRKKVSQDIENLETEYCFNIEITEPLTESELKILRWLLSETFEPENLSDKSFLNCQLSIVNCQFILEVGPRLNFTTAWSTNAVSVCHACGLTKINRIERSRRYKLVFKKRVLGFEDSRVQGKKEQSPESLTTRPLESFSIENFLELIHDRMTECPYPELLQTFETGIKPEPVYEIPLKEEGRDALRRINREMGLGLDEWDIDYYHALFVNELGRDPTNVECFDLSQSNSEHSRHWFFKGKLIIDDEEMPHTLLDVIKEPLRFNGHNSIIAFRDNSSAIKGYKISTLIPENVRQPSVFSLKDLTYHLIFTAETHNFPSGVAPFPGAETGTGGRIRDVQATGRGGLVIAGTTAYCVGNLLIPDYKLPWEDTSFIYPANLSSPLEIEIQASNGASDYGNKFGEPVIQGFTRSFGMRMPDGERVEWVKPIMFTGGIGQIDSRHIEKGAPERGMLVVKAGGPAYRIGIGGGAASSMIHGENIEELDFNAVQRGDAEMEQKLNRVIRACIEMGDKNPIVSIHDQGAGGNCNVVKEIIYPAGARIEVRRIQVGDETLSVLEIWGAEYQEQNAFLIRPDDIETFEQLCLREKVPCAVIGRVTGDGYIVLYDESDGSTPVNLPLNKILGDMPQKTFHLQRNPVKTQPLRFPWNSSTLTQNSTPNQVRGKTQNYIKDALERVLRLLSVGSKRFLTNKVDRSVTGLIARQQCAGPLHLTVSDVAVVSQSHFGLTGSAISIGEQPIKGLLNPSAMARMCVGEALTNIVWAKISALEDIKCSANWMWAAKLPGEGARIYDAVVALSDIMKKLGIAIDGGKDSLSMAAQVKTQNTEYRTQNIETVKSPGTLVISAYVSCPDITKVITPDIKMPGKSRLLFIDLGKGRNRLGGSALAHVYNQLGDEPPDVEDVDLLRQAFNAVQSLIQRDLILSGHDRSDGGLITTLLEMAFAGNCGMEINLEIQDETFMSQRDTKDNENSRGILPRLSGKMPDLFSLRVLRGEYVFLRQLIAPLFSEELGLVIEYLPENEKEIITVLKGASVPYQVIGKTLKEKRIKINLKILKDNENVIPAKAGIQSHPEFISGSKEMLKQVQHDNKELDSRLHGNDGLGVLLDEDMRVLRDIWEETSYQLERLQANPVCVEEEKRVNFDRRGPQYILTFTPENPHLPPFVKGGEGGFDKEGKGARVAIIREEGSNGDREMASAFYMAGFETWDVTMTDLLEKRVSLRDFRGIAFVGGFSYADVLDSAKGWAGVIRFNKVLWEEFQHFYNREDTFSLGVCNGCQLMALLGWVPWQGMDDRKQPRFIQNTSGRFESRFSTVKVFPSPSIMLKGMGGSVLGIWVAHGEGRAFFPDRDVLKDVEAKGLAPVRYVDDDNEITEKYPFNPNGSVNGISALCSEDGRHLAIMPHPERTFLKWQWAWMPEGWKAGASPWLKMFQNAREWCG